MYSKEILQNILTNNVATITFTKVDGTLREMKCTLMEQHLPLAFEAKNHVSRQPNDEVLAVWDLEKEAWRSFRLDSITQIEYEVGELDAPSP